MKKKTKPETAKASEPEKNVAWYCIGCKKKALEIEFCSIRRFRYQGTKAPCEETEE